MLGLETDDELRSMDDLREADVDVLTLGQYLGLRRTIFRWSAL